MTKKPEAADVSPNLELWEKVRTPNPKFTKAFNRGGFQGTAINPTYLMAVMTEVFGPVGQGWGFEILDEKILQGHRINQDNFTQLHVIRGHVWYLTQNKERCYTIPQFGQTFLVNSNKHGVFTDEEAPKKSLTDCFGKCVVSLGVAADVHLGLWDNSKYVNDAAALYKGERPVPKNREGEDNPEAGGSDDGNAELDECNKMLANIKGAIEGGDVRPFAMAVAELRGFHTKMKSEKRTGVLGLISTNIPALKEMAKTQGLTWPTNE